MESAKQSGEIMKKKEGGKDLELKNMEELIGTLREADALRNEYDLGRMAGTLEATVDYVNEGKETEDDLKRDIEQANIVLAKWRSILEKLPAKIEIDS